MKDEHPIDPRKKVTDVVTGAVKQGGMAVVNAILDQPNAEGLVQALHPEEFHHLVHEIGKADSADIMRCASVEQIQGMLDLDGWVGERFEPDRVQDLMGVAAVAGEDVVDRMFEAMDDETIALYLLRKAKLVQRTFEPEQEEAIQEQGEYFTTPDGQFFIVLPFGDKDFPAVRFFIDHFFAHDKEEAISMLKTMVFEDADVLEEDALRFRNARVQSMGFPTAEDIEKIFAYINPMKVRQKVRSGESNAKAFDVERTTLLPALIGLERQDVPFLKRVLDGFDDPESTAKVAEALIFLSNAVFSDAVGGDLSEMAKYPESLRRALSLFNLGLEYVTDGRPDAARSLLLRAWPKTLFRLGHSVTVLVREQARKLLPFTGREHGFYLFDPPLDDVIKGAGRPTAQFFDGLDDEKKATWSDFRSLAQVKKTKAVLRQAAAVADFAVRALKLDAEAVAHVVPEDLRHAVTHTTLMATALLNSLLGSESMLAPIEIQDVARVADVVLVQAEDGGRMLNPRLKAAVRRFNSDDPNKFAAALLDLSLRKLEDVFLRLPAGQIPEPRFLAGAILVKA